MEKYKKLIDALLCFTMVVAILSSILLCILFFSESILYENGWVIIGLSVITFLQCFIIFKLCQELYSKE